MQTAYYAPYESESEAESDGKTSSAADSDTESDASTGSGDSIARGLDDPRYAILKAAGPAMTATNQLFYEHGPTLLGSTYEPMPVKDASNNVIEYKSPLYGDPKKRVQSNLFSFKSADRDPEVYPLSTFFTLKTPRTYKNVTQIQIVQVNFQYFANAIPDLSNVYQEILNYVSTIGYDPSQCANCTNLVPNLNGLALSEVGRTNPVDPGQVLVHAVQVSPGDYDAPGLLAELDKQTNKTPPFRIVSYADHRSQFQATRTLTHLFNPPGPWTYQSQTGTFSDSMSHDDIVKSYFPHITLTSTAAPTDQEAFVAYFYPILKEALQDKFASLFLDLQGQSLRSVQAQVVQSYQGLQSTYYYALCVANAPYLRTFRRSLTFEYNPIHHYKWDHSPYTNKMSVVHTDLHPSLQKDIQMMYDATFQQQIAVAGSTPSAFAATEASMTQLTSIVSDLSNQVNKALTFVGIPQGLYPVAYLATPSSPLFTRYTPGQLNFLNLDDQLIDIATGVLQAPSAPGVLTDPVPPYDQGWKTLATLVYEAANVNSPGIYDPNYAASLNSLNNTSQLRLAGYNYTAGQTGVQVSCIDFPSLYSTFQSYVSTSQATSQAITNVHGGTLHATQAYLSNTYGTVLPPALLQNSAVLNGKGPGGVTFYGGQQIIKPSSPFDSVNQSGSIRTGDSLISISQIPQFTTGQSCCDFIAAALRNVYSCIPAEYIVINSVFQKAGFRGNILNYYSTIAANGTLVRNNIYLQLNTEQTMNNMDVAGVEQYNVSNETTGQHKVVLGKLLTEGTGLSDITQTIVQLPAKFETPLGALDHLSFTLLLDTLIPISQLFPFPLAGSEWNAILQIDEEVGTLDRETDLAPTPSVQWPGKPY